MISTKKGATDYLILVTITMIVAVVGIAASVIIGKELIDSSETTQSFKSLAFNIDNLDDGTANSTLFYLYENHYLVSFNNGNDFKGEEKPCKEEITIPKDECGGYPCLCICKGPFFSIISDLEDICIDNLMGCKKFDNTELTFLDKTCPSNGVLREGEDDSLMFLTYEKFGNTIYFCDDDTCVTSTEKLLVSSFEEQTNTYKSCLEKTGEAPCELDLEFLNYDTGLNFYTDKVELIDLATSSILSSDSFETKIANAVEFNDELEGADAITLYNLEITEVVGYGDVVDTETNAYTYISPYVNGEVNDNTQIKVSSTLLFKDSKLSFVPYEYDFSNIQETEEEQAFV